MQLMPSSSTRSISRPHPRMAKPERPRSEQVKWTRSQSSRTLIVTGGGPPPRGAARAGGGGGGEAPPPQKHIDTLLRRQLDQLVVGGGLEVGHLPLGEQGGDGDFGCV